MRRIFWMLMALVAAGLVACSAPPEPDPTRRPTLEPNSDDAPVATSAPANADSETTTNADLAVPRPSEPAAPEEWRADHPSHVAATGRPQLIEFFAYT